ncbi:UNVERIFIED_ORG: hypothetical protein GGE64_002131 [Rhizobium etli]|uniref:hypothetical protein n=1 Tax=Rhizobium TaxID=379 RepID=UPI0009900D2B|nr:MULTISPECIES: hypothetical protein [Rhizobium]ARQ59475.1 hypothetical protein Kim5_CH03453 [Rhizobium sp. Kim5]RSB92677.1 hypothetical protein EFR00_21075 [Rhizobium sophoriradicis]
MANEPTFASNVMPESGYGSDITGGFNIYSKAYKNDPSIENYIKLRRENPDAEIEVGVIGGIDQLFFMESELRRFAIDPELVAGAMDADPSAISELSLQLMEKMIERRKLSKGGGTHLTRRGLAIPDKLIDWIICCSLDALSWTDNLEVPRDLIVLIRERLCGSNPEYEQASRAHEQRMRAAIMGGQLKARGITPTLRMLAGLLRVAPSTVKRWFAEGEFERETERWSRMFDENGALIPLTDTKVSLRQIDTAQR